MFFLFLFSSLNRFQESNKENPLGVFVSLCTCRDFPLGRLLFHQTRPLRDDGHNSPGVCSLELRLNFTSGCAHTQPRRDAIKCRPYHSRLTCLPVIGRALAGGGDGGKRWGAELWRRSSDSFSFCWHTPKALLECVKAQRSPKHTPFPPPPSLHCPWWLLLHCQADTKH